MIVLYKKRNKGVVGVQDKDGQTWHTKGAFEYVYETLRRTGPLGSARRPLLWGKPTMWTANDCAMVTGDLLKC